MSKLTVLRVAQTGKIAAKTYSLDSNGGVTKQNYDAGTRFTFQAVEVGDIKSLSQVLVGLASDRTALVIRGQLLPDKNPLGVVTRTLVTSVAV